MPLVATPSPGHTRMHTCCHWTVPLFGPATCACPVLPVSTACQHCGMSTRLHLTQLVKALPAQKRGAALQCIKENILQSRSWEPRKHDFVMKQYRPIMASLI